MRTGAPLPPSWWDECHSRRSSATNWRRQPAGRAPTLVCPCGWPWGQGFMAIKLIHHFGQGTPGIAATGICRTAYRQGVRPRGLNAGLRPVSCCPKRWFCMIITLRSRCGFTFGHVGSIHRKHGYCRGLELAVEIVKPQLPVCRCPTCHISGNDPGTSFRYTSGVWMFFLVHAVVFVPGHAPPEKRTRESPITRQKHAKRTRIFKFVQDSHKRIPVFDKILQLITRKLPISNILTVCAPDKPTAFLPTCGRATDTPSAPKGGTQEDGDFASVSPKAASSNASSVIKIDIVNPMPPGNQRSATCFQRRPSGQRSPNPIRRRGTKRPRYPKACPAPDPAKYPDWPHTGQKRPGFCCKKRLQTGTKAFFASPLAEGNRKGSSTPYGGVYTPKAHIKYAHCQHPAASPPSSAKHPGPGRGSTTKANRYKNGASREWRPDHRSNARAAKRVRQRPTSPQIKDHEEDLKLFRDEADKGKNRNKAWAGGKLPSWKRPCNWHRNPKMGEITKTKYHEKERRKKEAPRFHSAARSYGEKPGRGNQGRSFIGSVAKTVLVGLVASLAIRFIPDRLDAMHEGRPATCRRSEADTDREKVKTKA
ncbi:hypothetical protein FQR65_LT20595 [Abscondita terminalis]|nr:hypothetical protein FQR65_LT20595 [Abscondita terminalis]